MEQYTVTGMSCAACSARVEKAVSKVPECYFLFSQFIDKFDGSRGSADPASIISAVEAAGYGASVKGADKGEHAGSR